MPDLDTAIDELRRFGSAAPQQQPDLERITRRVRSRRRRRRVALAGVACAFLAVGAAVVIDPGSKDRTLVETADEPDEVPPDRGTAALPPGSLVSGRVGIAQVDPQNMTLVHSEPTAIAFDVGGGTVVAQGADSLDPVSPLTPAGPILVIEGEQIREIPPGEGEQLRLLDATVIDGRPTSLVSVRRGTTPDDTDEELILLDTESGERTSLGVVGGWESGVFDARIAGSHIVTLLSAEASTFVVVRSLEGEVEWQLPDAYIDRRVSITVLGDELLVLQPGFEGDDLAPTVTIERFDLVTGTNEGSTNLALDLESGLEIGGGFCAHAESDAVRLYCDRSDGPPIVIDLDTGATRAITGVESGLVTLPRTTVAETITAGASEPCPGSVPRRADGGDPQADALPPLSASATDSASALAVLDEHRAALLDQYKASSAVLSHGFGRAWAGTNGGTYATVDLEDHGILLMLDRVDDCPSGAGLHRMIDGVPLFFHVGSTDPAVPDPDRTVPLAAREAIEALIRFAQNPTPESAAAVPFGTPLRIGLGAELLRKLDHTSSDPEAWTLDLDGRWASEGPISALGLLRDSPTLSLTRDRPASCGSTTSPPVPPELTPLTRLSLTPTGGDSCLSWFAVDVYVDGAGSIEAVTVELYEP